MDLLTDWSTDDAPQGEAFDYWRDSICAAFDPMSPELGRDSRACFQGRIRVFWQAGEASLMEIRSSPHETGRSARDIARGSRDYVYLYKQLASAWFGFDDRDGFVTGRDTLVFGDADRPFTTGPTGACGFHHMVLKMPRAAFEPVLARPQDIGARVVSAPGGMGALLSTCFDGLLAEAPDMSGDERKSALGALTMLVASAYGRPTADHDPRDAMREARLIAAKRAVECLLADPRLTPSLLARHLGMSTRLLHRLFETSGTTVSRYILQRRLQLARRRLEDTGRHHESILCIALDCGFESLATFYRAFGREYGLAPAQHRSLFAR